MTLNRLNAAGKTPEEIRKTFNIVVSWFTQLFVLNGFQMLLSGTV